MEQKLLHVLPKCRNLIELKQLHPQILIHGLQERGHVVPKLLELASSFQSLSYATQVFNNVKKPNVVAFNTLIKCFIDNRSHNDAFSAYRRMRLSENSPNNYTFTFLLKACEAMESLDLSRAIHAQIMKFGFGLTVFVQNSLLSVYSNCSNGLAFARQMFDEMPDRDVVTWNSMISVYMACGEIACAIQLFETMPERNLVSSNSVIVGLCRAGDMRSAQVVFDRMAMRTAISWNSMITGYVKDNDVAAAQSVFDQMEDKDVVSWTAIVTGYTKIGDLESAEKLFDRMPAKNVVSWNAMIAGYNENSQFDRALCVFQRMLLDGRFQPDEATLVSVLTACAHLGSRESGEWVHSYMKLNKVHLTTPLGNALIDMFAKCGDIRSSKLVFNQMTKRSIITWTTIIWGLGVHGQCRQALALFERMCQDGIRLDDVIFIAVLSACTHGGLVEEGQRIFDLMIGHYSIKPRLEHYGCLVDLLGRAGRFAEALRFIQHMPIKPGIEIWATLLSSCNVVGARELSEYVSQKIIDLEPSNPAYQVLVSNSSAREGRWEGVVGIRTTMRREGIEKVPGCSSIQVGDQVSEFLAKDSRHERRKEIYEALDGLTRLIKQLAYCTKSGEIMQDKFDML